MARKPGGTGAVSQSRLSRAAGSVGRGAAAGLVRLLPTAAVILVLGVAVKALEYQVLELDAARSARVRVHLVDCPESMPTSLASQIAGSLLVGDEEPAGRDLTKRVYARAMANPWIRTVRCIRKRPAARSGTIAVDVYAEYRRAVARVQVGRGCVFVSGAGVRLPAHQVAKYEARIAAYRGAPAVRRTYVRESEVPPGVRASAMHYILIYGVKSAPPGVAGPWQGQDLVDGLKLVKLVESRPYAEQITVVDVRNHGGRVSANAPHLRMYAQTARGRATDIRFGQFPIDGGDYVVTPSRKLSYLDQYVGRNNGRLAGINQYLDLRYDQLHVSIN